jgi:hypothetical protein
MGTTRGSLIICGVIISLLFALPITELQGKENLIKTEPSRDIDTGERYSLILYGARHGNDLESLAILDIEGDEYTFEPYAPEFDYKVEKGMDSSAAIKRAEGFVSWHPLFYRSELKRIIYSGRVIGYELRPLYDPLTFGISDLIDTDYGLKGKKVIVRIRLLPQIERMLHDGDRVRERDGN